YDTNLALADAAVPVLVPADQQDLFDLALYAFRLSRFCGSWVGVRIVTSVADGIGSIVTDVAPFAGPDPRVLVGGERWEHRPLGNVVGLGDVEALWLDRRLAAAQGWARATGLDRTIGAAPGARLGVICAGKTYCDTLAALEGAGIEPDGLERAGVRILRLGLT